MRSILPISSALGEELGDEIVLRRGNLNKHVDLAVCDDADYDEQREALQFDAKRFQQLYKERTNEFEIMISKLEKSLENVEKLTEENKANEVSPLQTLNIHAKKSKDKTREITEEKTRIFSKK